MTSEALDRTVSLTRISHLALETNQIRTVNFNAIELMVRPGIYKDIHAIVSEINNLNCTKNHVEFRVKRGGYVTCARVCTKATCYQLSHQLFLSKKWQKIQGFEKMNSFLIKDQESIEGDRPVHLSNSLSSMFLIYNDIWEPYVTGDVQTRLLRAVSLNIDDYTYGSIPLLFKSFQTIEIDIRDQSGRVIPFDYGTLTVTLHLKRLD